MANLPQRSLSSHQNDASYLYSPPSVNEASSPLRRYECSVCSTSFRRREHFERHVQSHSKSKNFKCDVCEKGFTRRDTLQRHSAIHGQVATKVQKPLPRAPRACLNCIKSKQRCSGSHPCDRCNHKNWLCQFPRGSRNVGPQRQEILPETTERSLSIPNNRRLMLNELCEPSLASAISPVSTSCSDPKDSGSLAFPGGAYGDPIVPNQPEQTAQYNDAPSLFDSFLLWPMDDAFDNYNISGDHSSLQTTPGPTGTIAQPQPPATLHGGVSVTGLRSAFNDTSRHPTEDPRPPFSGHLSNYLRGIDLTEEDRDILISEDYAHVPRPSNEIYESICGLYAEVSRSSPEACLPNLPSLEILHVCTQLYFEHFHPGFPILHQGTFGARSSSWLLYLVTAAVGSQYSRLSTRAKLFTDLVKIVRVSLLRKLNYALTMQNDLELAQATLLFNMSLLFGGSREGLMHLQYQRNVLITMCRPLLVPGILFAKSWMLSNASVPYEDWNRWVATESWKRVIYFTWLMECCQLVLLDLPTIISINDMHISMPCHDELWRCENFHDWERVKALQRGPQESLGLFSLLKMGDIDHECIAQLSDTALWLSAVSVYVADRQDSQQRPLLFGSQTTPDHRNVDSTELVHAAGSEEDNIDVILGRFQQAVNKRRHKSPICLIVAKLSLIMRLLRFIKYRPLYLSSGWMAQTEDIRAARQHIADLLHANPRQARQGLLNAAQLFRMIRSQRQFDPFDSFLLLMIILYIWNYDRYVISNFPLSEGGEEIFRIDQNIDADLQEKWIAGTFENQKQLHISGIGVLNGQDSMPRIFKEAMRILDHDKAWSRQADAIKWSLHQILRGGAPSFADAEAATNETVA